MKQLLIVAAVVFSLINFTACGDTDSDARISDKNSKISWQEFEVATRTASEENKKLFVYVHTDWCSWCRRMENETFADDAVTEYMNQNFVPIELDAESSRKVTFNGREMSEQEVASALGVQGYPTHVFLNSSGEPITIAPGYLPPERFIHMLSFIAEDYYKDTNWEEYLNSRKE